MRTALFSTPRPEPGHVLPAVGGALVVLVALPVFLLLDWPLAGWGLAAVIWVVVHAIDLLLVRARRGNAAVLSGGLQAFGVFFKSIGLLAVLLAAAVASAHVALGAAVVYALAYTFELGLSLFAYFGGTR